MAMAIIRQFNKDITRYNVMANKSTPSNRQQAVNKARKLVESGQMETGYFDFIICPFNRRDRELDSDVLIA